MNAWMTALATQQAIGGRRITALLTKLVARSMEQPFRSGKDARRMSKTRSVVQMRMTMGNLLINAARPQLICAYIVALSIVSIPSIASAQSQPVKDLIAIARDLDSMCRGSSGDTPNLEHICAIRDRTFSVVGAMGYCYGKKGEYGAQMRWHRCTKDSFR